MAPTPTSSWSPGAASCTWPCSSSRCAAMASLLQGYEPWAGAIGTARNGVLIASEGGVALTYGLNNAQARGQTFIEPGTPVYEGMIVGLNARPDDLVVNVCKEKKATNVR